MYVRDPLFIYVDETDIGQFLAKMGEMRFFQKSAWNIFFRFYKPPSNCKVSKKVMKGFRGNTLQTD